MNLKTVIYKVIEETLDVQLDENDMISDYADSLDALVLANELEKALNITIEDDLIADMKSMTVNELAAALSEKYSL